MRRHPVIPARTTWIVAAALLVLPPVAPARAGTGDRPPLAQWLPRLRQGTWVKVEGNLRAGGGLQAREIKILSGDLDESEITSTITSIDSDRKSFATRSGVRVVTDRRTEVQDPRKRRTGFGRLAVGDRVETEGPLQKDGTLLADEIEIKKPARPDQEPDDEFTGRIESVDVEARKIVLLGVPVFLDERTKNKTPYFE